MGTLIFSQSKIWPYWPKLTIATRRDGTTLRYEIVNILKSFYSLTLKFTLAMFFDQGIQKSTL